MTCVFEFPRQIGLITYHSIKILVRRLEGGYLKQTQRNLSMKVQMEITFGLVKPMFGPVGLPQNQARGMHKVSRARLRPGLAITLESGSHRNMRPESHRYKKCSYQMCFKKISLRSVKCKTTASIMINAANAASQCHQGLEIPY